MADLKLNFTDSCYLASHCEIHESEHAKMNHSQLMNLYSSSLQMIREILSRYLSCYVVSLDLKHFALIFHFPSIEETDWAQISSALDNACSMIDVYKRQVQSFQNQRGGQTPGSSLHHPDG